MANVLRRFLVRLEHDPEAGVWVAYVPQLGDLSTFGDTRAEACENAREAIQGYLEAAEAEGMPVDLSDVEWEEVEIQAVG
jgi:predicted RNase H-like HicB family nuclease